MLRRVFLSLAFVAGTLACGGDQGQQPAAGIGGGRTPQHRPPAAAVRALGDPRPHVPVWKIPPGEAAHGISMYGDLKYPPDFAHFDYVNPDAPKGGRIRFGVAPGTFDSFNPWIIKGNPAAGIDNLYETLLVASADEPFSEYGLLAKSVQTPEDRSWVLFELRPEARWHDGTPITADDVVWSFETLLAKGQPSFRFYYQSVDRVEKVGTHGVKFHFKPGTNRELPLIVGQLPVFPKHWWATRDFESPSLEPPLGSGPYKVGSFEPGRFIEVVRVPDYWGADLPVNRGRHNFDVQRFEYYRDTTVSLEAFKGGAYDFRQEISAKDWATAYDVPEVRDGRIVKEAIAHQRPGRHAGLRDEPAPPALPGPPRARGARPRVRLRVVQPGALPRPVRALAELLRELRAGGDVAFRRPRSSRSSSRSAAASRTRSSRRSSRPRRPTARATTATTCGARPSCWPRRAGRPRTASS